MTATNLTSAGTSDGVQAQIRALEQERFDATIHGRFDDLAGLCHRDLRYTHSNAAVDSFNSYLDRCRSGYYDYRSIEHPIERIDVVGDVALVFGGMTADLSVDGVPVRLDNTSLAVWVRTGGEWKLIAYQPTVIPK